ncbi:helix-turn-helix domain-containing protein [Alkalimonas sp. MEB108]|uniref:Helix-turn-helix domain-containing protein n=1 Tax=Alkalimonas cellulosilytica TaxID=3058395 RepID=A0ABU7J578_9GAMM|nr:helix-turn-helix domain-containing protein [Alkalimonas sp. MEB108]MEE2001649.1 helix-turn-helix domain-containing protein [Alkalimonas sp. MEB108]
MQFFKIKYGRHSTYVVSMKDGDKVVPRLLNRFIPQVALTRVFEMSTMLIAGNDLPGSMEVEELSLADLYQYILDCPCSNILKVTSVVREAWFSFHEGRFSRHRADRKLTPEKLIRLRKLIAKKRPKAEIARELEISRQALYQAIEKLKHKEYEEQCAKGLITKVGRQAFQTAPEGSSWATRYLLREQAKVRALGPLLGFDLAQLKQEKVST